MHPQHEKEGVNHTPHLVSVFDSSKGATETRPTSTEALEAVISAIKQGKWKHQVQAVRRHQYGTEAYRKAKTRLPYFTPHGTFAARKDAAYQAHSRVLGFDVDLKDNPDTDPAELRQSIAKNPYLAYLFTSPGGGLKFGCRVKDLDQDSHRGKEKALRLQLENLYGISLDASQGRLSQPCFVSYDPDAVYKPTGPAYQVEAQPDEKPATTTAKASSAPRLKSTSTEPVADRLAKALADVEVRTEYKFEPGQRHNYLASLSIYANLRGIELADLQSYVYANLLEASQITSNVFEPYQAYASDFARWANDPFAYDLEGPTLEFRGYIGKDAAVCKALADHVEAHQRTIIKAPTGSGKTWWVMNVLAPRLASVEHPLILACPTQALADQLAAENKLPKIRQGKTFQDLEAAKAAPVVVCTYDSAPALRAQIEAGTLVIDEAHHIAGDHTFKRAQIEAFEGLIMAAPRVVQISATPTAYWQRAGFAPISLHQTDTKQIKVHPVHYEERAFDEAMSRLMASIPDRLQVVFWDSKKDLEALRRQLIATGKYKPDQVALLTSDNKETNTEYQRIITASTLSASTRLVLATRLIADGVNINGIEAADIHAVKVKNDELFVQFPARFRESDLTVFAYGKRKEDQPKGTPPKTAESLEGEEKHAEAAAALANIYRSAPDEGTTQARYFAKRQDNLHLIRDAGTRFAPCLSAIYNQEIGRREFCSDLADMLARVESTYPHFQIEAEAAPVDKIDNSLAEAAAAQDKRQQKAAELEAYKLATTKPDVFALAAYQAGNWSTRKQIEHVVPMHPDPSSVEAAANMQAEHPEVFQRATWRHPAKQLGKLKALHPTADLADLASVLKDEKKRSKKGFSELENRVWVQRALSGEHELNAIEKVRAKYLEALRAELADYVVPGAATLADVEANKRLTPGKLAEIVSRHTGKDVGQQAARIARELFHVGQGKGPGGKQRFYFLTGFVSLADVEAESSGKTAPVDKIKTSNPKNTSLILSTTPADLPDFTDKFDPTESAPF